MRTEADMEAAFVWECDSRNASLLQESTYPTGVLGIYVIGDVVQALGRNEYFLDAWTLQWRPVNFNCFFLPEGVGGAQVGKVL